MSATPTTAPSVAEIERANVQAEYDELSRRFELLSAEWNRLNRAINLNARDVVVAPMTADLTRQADVASELKRVGERMIVLKRTLVPDPISGYNLEGGCR